MPIPLNDNPVSRALLRDVVESKIRCAILTGSLAPGEPLHDDDLTAWLGASRTPIREALASLARAGLIEMTPSRHTRVATPRNDRAVEALQALGALFSAIVRMSVPILTNTQRREAVSRINRERQRLASGGTARVAFHAESGYAAWLDVCPNATLAAAVREVMPGLAFALRVDVLPELVPSGQLARDLADFANAVDAGDHDLAALIVDRIHLTKTRGTADQASQQPELASGALS